MYDLNSIARSFEWCDHRFIEACTVACATEAIRYNLIPKQSYLLQSIYHSSGYDIIKMVEKY